MHQFLQPFPKTPVIADLRFGTFNRNSQRILFLYLNVVDFSKDNTLALWARASLD